MKMSRPELQESCDREGHHQEGAAYDGVGMSGHQLAPPDRWELRGDRRNVYSPIKEILQTLREKVADFLDEEHHPCQCDPATARNWNKIQWSPENSNLNLSIVKCENIIDQFVGSLVVVTDGEVAEDVTERGEDMEE